MYAEGSMDKRKIRAKMVEMENGRSKYNVINNFKKETEKCTK
jgi:hypothetical protein